ncbi:MAG: amidohydrolase, partial [Rhizobacter sp.]|nr:amidohydrolase [Rhizobacter sp.]
MMAVVHRFTGARLPRWALPADWPLQGTEPVLADLMVEGGLIASVTPQPSATGLGAAVLADLAARTAASFAAGMSSPQASAGAAVVHLDGAPVLPGLVEAHAHLDKAFTLHRMGPVQPGLLGAIAAMHKDRAHWTAPDVRERASQALGWAFEAGVVHLRTHVDWWEPAAVPIAWGVMNELALEWADRLVLERVSLMPLTLFAQREAAHSLASQVARSGQGARLGGFVHTSNWDAQALAHLLESAEAFGLDVDLHVDEELNAAAQGLATTARLMRDIGFSGRVVCSHACALAAQPEAQALSTLDAVAGVAITLVALPITNLLLQDATTGRTPRQRGLTLVKEARSRGIPVLIGSDNVQDPFCAVGSFDPIEAFSAGVLAGQLDQPFDIGSESLCRADWLTRGPPAPPLQAGSPADWTVFGQASVQGFPSRTQPRTVVRNGRLLADASRHVSLATP